MSPWHELEPSEQQEIRQLIDCFMLTSGATQPVTDELIQPIMSACLTDFHLQLKGIGFQRQDFLGDEINFYQHCDTRRHLAMTLIIASTVLGQQPTRKILSQALVDLSTLQKLGETLWYALQYRLKESQS